MSVNDARRIGRIGDFESGIPHAVQLPDGNRLCVIREGSAVFAIVDRCPHRDFPLSGGDLIRPHVLECPWHGAQFDYRTGQWLSGPECGDVTSFEVEVVNGDVFVGRARGELKEEFNSQPPGWPDDVDDGWS